MALDELLSEITELRSQLDSLNEEITDLRLRKFQIQDDLKDLEDLVTCHKRINDREPTIGLDLDSL